MSYGVPHRGPSLPVRMRVDGVPSKRWPFEMETIVGTALPDRFPARASRWITRARPKIDRIACPWLIRRFVDPEARFLYVSPPEVTAVAERFGATPFDIEGVHWSHRGELCTFDVMVQAFGLALQTFEELQGTTPRLTQRIVVAGTALVVAANAGARCPFSRSRKAPERGLAGMTNSVR